MMSGLNATTNIKDDDHEMRQNRGGMITIGLSLIYTNIKAKAKCVSTCYWLGLFLDTMSEKHI